MGPLAAVPAGLGLETNFLSPPQNVECSIRMACDTKHPALELAVRLGLVEREQDGSLGNEREVGFLFFPFLCMLLHFSSLSWRWISRLRIIWDS